MNNNIEEDYCSFELSKLLYKKGARLKTHYNSQANNLMWYWKYGNELHSWSFFASFDNMLPAPTHALAIKWIRENFGLAISVDLIDNKFYFSIRNIKTKDYASRKGCIENGYESANEATEAALLYVLTKLNLNDTKID